MAKQKDKIDYVTEKRLNEIRSYGEPKHMHKAHDRQIRQRVAEKGFREGKTQQEIRQETREKSLMTDRVYSVKYFKDIENTGKSISKFAIERLGTNRMSLDQLKEVIPDYVKELKENGYSIDGRKTNGRGNESISKEIHRICKLYRFDPAGVKRDIEDRQAKLREQGRENEARVYDLRSKPYALNTRSNDDYKAKREDYNREKGKDALDLNRCIGCRRHELDQIKLKDIRETDRGIEFDVHHGKNNKFNTYTVRWEETKQIEVCKHYIDQAKEAGRDRLMSEAQMKNNADLHQTRAERAKDVYKAVCDDIRQNPDRKEYYRAEIDRYCREKNRTLDKQEKSLLDRDKKYFCRGENKKILEERGIETIYDRIPLMYTSVLVLQHWRAGVSVQHYLTKS